MRALIISAIFIMVCTYLMVWTPQSETEAIIIIAIYAVSFLVFVVSAITLIKKETRY